MSPCSVLGGGSPLHGLAQRGALAVGGLAQLSGEGLQALAQVAPHVLALSHSEDLPGHGEAVLARFGDVLPEAGR